MIKILFCIKFITEKHVFLPVMIIEEIIRMDEEGRIYIPKKMRMGAQIMYSNDGRF
jgi:DNA-binding transcriptional regulator/RsmH inhibitor MraZ